MKTFSFDHLMTTTFAENIEANTWMEFVNTNFVTLFSKGCPLKMLCIWSALSIQNIWLQNNKILNLVPNKTSHVCETPMPPQRTCFEKCDLDLDN